MGDVIDIRLLADARRCLDELLDERGIRYFMKNEGPKLLQLEPRRVEQVLKSAARRRAPGRARPPTQAVEHVRREIRRELIRRVVAEMLAVGF